MAKALEVLYIIIIIVLVNIYIDLRHYRKSDAFWVTNETSSACAYGNVSKLNNSIN